MIVTDYSNVELQTKAKRTSAVYAQHLIRVYSVHKKNNNVKHSIQ